MTFHLYFNKSVCLRIRKVKRPHWPALQARQQRHKPLILVASHSIKMCGDQESRYTPLPPWTCLLLGLSLHNGVYLLPPLKCFLLGSQNNRRSNCSTSLPVLSILPERNNCFLNALQEWNHLSLKYVPTESRSQCILSCSVPSSWQ